MTEKAAPSLSINFETGDIRVNPKAKLLERLEAEAEPIPALADIHFKLAVATEFFEGLGDGGRYGTYRAVLDIVDYFASLSIPRATLQPLKAVAEAIVDADRGTESAIFRPDRGPGAPPSSVARLSLEGHLAVVAECCVRHVRSQGARPYVAPGCQLAAKLINASRLPAKVTVTQLTKIRERVQQAGKNSPDGIVFLQLMDSQVAAVRPLEWAQLLLQHEWVSVVPTELSF